MWMTKYRFNYISTLTHRHGCEIHFNSDGLKWYDRFTDNVMFEFSWNVTSKIKYERLGRIEKCVGAKNSRIKASGTRKSLITSFSKRFR